MKKPGGLHRPKTTRAPRAIHRPKTTKAPSGVYLRNILHDNNQELFGLVCNRSTDFSTDIFLHKLLPLFIVMYII